MNERGERRREREEKRERRRASLFFCQLICMLGVELAPKTTRTKAVGKGYLNQFGMS